MAAIDRYRRQNPVSNDLSENIPHGTQGKELSDETVKSENNIGEEIPCSDENTRWKRILGKIAKTFIRGAVKYILGIIFLLLFINFYFLISGK